MNCSNPHLILQDVAECLTEQAFKDKALKCKVLALAHLKYDPIHTNPSTLPPRIKRQILGLMSEYMITDDTEINNQFNEIVNGEILGCGIEYEKYNVIVNSPVSEAINIPADPPSETEYIEPVAYTPYSNLTPEEMWRM